MKLDTPGLFTIILATLSFPTLVSTAPPINPSSPKPKHDWAFKLYHSNRCTGKAVEFTGIGSSGCRSDLPNGGAKGYFRGHIDPACIVNLYKDDHCGRDQRLDDIRSNIDDKCKKIPGKKKKRVKSFDVICS